MELTPANRTDIVEECKFRISVLEEFAPEMMGEEEIKTAVKEVLDELGVTQPSVQDKGKIMKALMPKVKGKADGKLVSEVLAGMLAE